MLTYPTFEQLRDYIKEGYMFLPIAITKKVTDFNPIMLLERIKDKSNYYFILESNKTNQYTYIGGNPLYVIKGESGKTVKINRDGTEEIFKGNPLEVLSNIMSLYSIPRINELPKFHGGAVGYLSYDMVRYFEELPDNANNDLKIPELYFIILDILWAYNNDSQQLYYIEYIFIKDIGSLKSLYDRTIERMKLTWEKLFEESGFPNKNFFI